MNLRWPLNTLTYLPQACCGHCLLSPTLERPQKRDSLGSLREKPDEIFPCFFFFKQNADMENKNNLAVLCSFDLLCIHQLHVREVSRKPFQERWFSISEKLRGHSRKGITSWTQESLFCSVTASTREAKGEQSLKKNQAQSPAAAVPCRAMMVCK